ALTGQPAGPPVTVAGASFQLALDRDGIRLLTQRTIYRGDGTSEDEARLWDVAGGRPLCPPFKVSGRGVALHPDGRSFAAEEGGGPVGAGAAATGDPPPPALDAHSLRSITFVERGLVTVSPPAPVPILEERPPLIRHWDLAPTALPADDLERLAALL